MTAEVKKVNWTEKTKNVPFTTFCEIINSEAGKEVDKSLIKKHYQDNLNYTLRTAVSKTLSEIRQQSWEKDLEEWRGIALGMRDFTWKDQDPEQLKQTWITFIKDDDEKKLEELKNWGTHINNQKVPFGSLLEVKGSLNVYKEYRNWMPKRIKILKELTREEIIAKCAALVTPVENLTRGMLYSPIVVFGEVGRVIGVTKFTDGAKDGSFDLYQLKRDGSDSLAFSLQFKLQGPNLITIDFEPQALGIFYFNVLDWDELIDSALQTDNNIRELSNALVGRKIFALGNLFQAKDGYTNTESRDLRYYYRIRGTALVEADEIPKGLTLMPSPSSKSSRTSSSTPAPQKEADLMSATIKTYKRILPILHATTKINEEDGAQVTEIAKELGMEESEVTERITEMINDGYIYQPSAGKYKPLATKKDIENYEEQIKEYEAKHSTEEEEEEDEEEEEEEEESHLELPEQILQRLMKTPDPKKWFTIEDLMDLSSMPDELEATLKDLRSRKLIAKSKGKEKYRLKVTKKEAEKIIKGTPETPTSKKKKPPSPKSKSEYTNETVSSIKDAIDTLGENTTPEAIKESGLVDDTIPLEVITKILTDIRNKK